MEIWHNPRCSKSRETLALIEASGVTPEIRRYLDQPPTADELSKTLDALGIEPWQLIRRGEPVFKELGMASWAKERSIWIEAMVANPTLIERPVVITQDGRAVVGRPPQNVTDLL